MLDTIEIRPSEPPKKTVSDKHRNLVLLKEALVTDTLRV